MSRKINIDQLETNLFVRKSLDQDWALDLALMQANGVKLPAIEVTENKFFPEINKKLLVVDGRHRIEAHQINDVAEIEYELVTVNSIADLIARGYKANTGGPMPPRREDTEHTIRLLIANDTALKNVAELLGLPAGITRKYIADIRAKDKRAQEMKAAAGVTEGGLTVPKAAEQYGVEEDRLREVLGGRTRTHKKGVEEMQRAITQQYRSHSQKIANLLRGLSDKYDDGDVSARQVAAVLDHIEKSHKNVNRRVADWRKRMAASGAETASAKKAA